MVNSNGISFSGLASGLDTTSIINQLVALERIPIQMLEAQKAQANKKLDKLGEFETIVKALQTAAEKLSTTEEFFAWKVENSDTSIASISAVGGAQPGVHTLEVSQLAAVDRWAFDGVSDPDADLATVDGQQLAFDIGTTSYSLTVNAATSSLNNIASAIETMAGDDVTAEVVNTGTEANPDYRLVLAAKDSGEDNRIANIVTDIAGLGITYSAPDADGNATSANNLTVGLNATATIDGLLFERTDNDFSDVYTGIDINLLATTEVDSPISFTIDPDKEVIRENVDGFVEAFNSVVSFINKQSTYTPSDDEDEPGITGDLFGDTVLSSVRSAVNRSLFNVDFDDVINDTAGFSTLGLVGIEQQNDGTLVIDDTVFDEKMVENLELLGDLFLDSDGFDNGGADPNTEAFYQDTTADSGLAANLIREIDRLFGSSEGPIDPDTGERINLDAIFDLREDTIRDTMDRFDDQITTLERRLESFEANLIQRFTNLEQIMGALNAQGAALNSIFAA